MAPEGSGDDVAVPKQRTPTPDGSDYGYKNHVNVDRRHKLVRRYQVS